MREYTARAWHGMRVRAAGGQLSACGAGAADVLLAVPLLTAMARLRAPCLRRPRPVPTSNPCSSLSSVSSDVRAGEVDQTRPDTRLTSQKLHLRTAGAHDS